MSTGSTERRVKRVRDGDVNDDVDQLAIEEPLEVHVDGQPLAVTMRTPGHDRDLAAGFCVTEGVVQASDDIESVEPCAIDDYGNVVDVRLSESARQRCAPRAADATRELYLSSSCGLCGKQSIDRIEQRVSPIDDPLTVARDVLLSLPDRMRAAQSTFDQTGGLHAAALFKPAGDLIVLREDVGRHNAVDKVVGHEALLGRLPIRSAVLVVSGRASFEIMQKAAVAGVPCVAAVSAPSSLAVDFAARLDMTLVGFLRPGRMNIYHGAKRVS